MAPTALSTRDRAPVVDSDPLDLDVSVITEVGADRIPVACGTSDGCDPSCASSCTSAV